MRTRTLLLLAVSCGLAILLAGGVQLYRISNQQSTPLLRIGDTGTVGDARVTVESVRQAGDRLVVTVVLGGVDDEGGIDGFRLVAPNRRVAPSAGAGSCTRFTVVATKCDLVFATDGLDGSVRQLLFERADERARWSLVA